MKGIHQTFAWREKSLARYTQHRRPKRARAGLLTGASIIGAAAALMAAAFQAPSAHAAPWAESETPFWFNHYQERNWQQVPSSGRVTQDVWTSSYFPLYADSINDRWYTDGINGITSPQEYSPAEKYDIAFNGWTTPPGFSTMQPFSRANWQTFDPEYHSSLGPLADFVTNERGNFDDRNVALARRDGAAFTGWPMQSWWGTLPRVGARVDAGASPVWNG